MVVDVGQIRGDFRSDASEIILVKDSELYSMCEHHFPVIGPRAVATFPTAK